MKTPLRDVYEKIGKDYKDLWGSWRYLSELACVAGVDVDNYLLRRNLGLESFEEFHEFLKEINFIANPDVNPIETDPSLSLAFWHVLDSERKIHTVKEVGLLAKKLSEELGSLPTLSEDKLKDLRARFIEFSRYQRSYRHGLAA